MRLEKGLKMLIVSSYPPRVWISNFQMISLMPLKNVFGDTLPL
jgi:hypothetical protein